MRLSNSAWVAATLCLAVLPLPLRADDKSPEEAKKVAQKVLDEGAKEFARKDKRVMARWYTEDAEAKLFVREDSGSYKVESYRGRAEIEDLYGKLFESEEKLNPKNVVESARFLSDDLLAVSGVFTPTENGNFSVQFVQVRQKVDKNWLIRDLQVFYIPNK